MICFDHTGKKFGSMSDRASYYGLTARTVAYRVGIGWGLETALTTPIGSKDCSHFKVSCEDHLGRKFSSNRERALHYNIPEGVIWARLDANWDLEKSLTTPVSQNSHAPNKKGCLDHKGNYFNSKQERASFWKLPDTIICSRLKRGWSLEKTLTTLVSYNDCSHRKNSCEDHLGRKFSSKKERASYYGLTEILVLRRLSANWTLEKALTTTVREKKTKE